MEKKSNKKGPNTIFNPTKDLIQFGNESYQKIAHPEIISYFKYKSIQAPHPAPIQLSKDAIDKIILTNKFPTLNKALNILPTEIKKIKTKTVVAILDTGVYAHHQDLEGQVIFKTNYTGDPYCDVDDFHGHGTHLAGIICGLGKTYKEAIGISTNTKIVSVKVTNRNSAQTSWWKVADGLERVIEYNANPINKLNKITIALICFNSYDNVQNRIWTDHHRLYKLIEQLKEQNIPTIVSAGNNYIHCTNEGLGYPAYLKNIIAIGASHNLPSERFQVGDIASFSQRVQLINTEYGKQFLVAPGVQTISCGIQNNTDYAILSGSSQSAAVYAGIVARYQEKMMQTNSNLPDINIMHDYFLSHAYLRNLDMGGKYRCVVM